MVRRTRETRLALAGLALGLVGLLGCTTVQEVGYAVAVREQGTALTSKKGLPVAGYVDRKSERHAWSARAFLGKDGSITFRRKTDEVRVPRRDLRALLVARTDGEAVGTGFGSVLGVLACAAGAFVLGVGQVLLVLL